MFRLIAPKTGILCLLLLSRGLHAEQSTWVEEDLSTHVFQSDLSQEPAADFYNSLWRCDAAPVTFGFTTYWIHANVLVACQTAVTKCQQINDVPCIYRYYRVQ